MVRLSIITAALNALPALRETAHSVAIQTARDVEHIIVDGGSEDGTREWLASQNGVRWISESDCGIADALNKGFRIAAGEFVLVLQAGDTLLAPSSLSEALAASAAARPPADILAFDIMLGAQRRLKQRRPGLRLEWKPLHHQGVLFRRELFDLIGPFDSSYRVCMDYELLLRAKRRGARLRGVALAISRMDDRGISSRRDWPSLRARFAEERRVHLTQAPRPARPLYSLYWFVYLRYRRLKHGLSQWRDRR